jgi:REP element-mobilizing transposase RayT
MSLFQKSVEQKYLKQLDSKLIETKYNEFKTYFGNPVIQENIRNSKEEQFQEGFLRELFVKILGYTLNPSPDFNLTTEYKNIKDSKKADGAIIVNSIVKGIIELKGTDTTDLGKVESQAFGYKNNQTDCVYIITSNFEKLRFYIDNAIEHLEFNLFTLTKQDFEILFLCLAYDSIAKGTPKKIKDESVSQEDKITKELYRDYSLFKKELYQNLVTLNPQVDSLTLYKKSQKLLDRFLFLFFAEDRNLLPPNSVRLVLNDWKELVERDEVKPLYDRFKKYFEYLNTGYKGKRYDVFAYNGGLFKPDEILDKVIIDDDLLYKHTLKLSEYDFVSEVDVNILGHIFENSLNELDEIKAQQEGQEIDKSKTKRKKDGVFYTPKYITKYIVENTIGKLCQEKKAELLISEEEYTTDRKRQLKTKALLVEKLKVYREWLLQLTICDPACGSGAFLNQALDFLISEHRYIDELQAKLFGDSLILSDIEKSILENNLFGVDLNEESVEIAKLSLWLRTAQPNRKLNDLNNNIKCGNSLIDDPAIAGDKAFNWQKEFPKIFQEKHKKAFHITFVLHNSRYATAKGAITDGLTRRLSSRSEPGFIARTFPEFTEQEQEIVAEELAKAAKEYNLNILECNVCNDHVHSILVCEEEELSTLVGKWKGRTAFEYNRRKNSRELLNRQEDNNRRVNPSVAYPLGEYPSVASPSVEKRKPNYADGTIEKLWAKSFYPKEITDEQQMQNTIQYIRNNRHKHDLPPSTDGLTRWLKEMTCTHNHAYRTEYTGGFDVVIGNPPYVQLQSMGGMSDMLKNCGYVTYDKGADLYCIFTERGYGLLKFGGIQSFIMPNKWMLVAYGKPLRKFLSKTGLHQVLNFGDVQFFQEATTYICIFVTQKSAPKDNVEVLSLNQKTYHGDFLTEVKKNLYDYPASRFGESEWSIQPYNDSRKLEQMKLNGIELKDLPISIYRGILTGYNEAFYIDEATRLKLIDTETKSAELIKPMVRGRDITAYEITGFEYLICTFPSLKLDIENYPAIKEHLLSFGYDRLKQSGDNGARKKTNGNWFETQDSIGYHEEFAKPKIIYPNMTSAFPFMYD